MESAFPGVRGFKWFTDPKKAVKRLLILLKPPLNFAGQGGRAFPDPIWWWRGGAGLHIDHFETLSETKGLMGHHGEELEIDKIAAYRDPAYFKGFVYVETKPEPQIGLYNYTEEDIKWNIEHLDYAREEYALFGNIPVTRGEYDDGAAEINGEVVDIRGAAKLRIRYLSRYNFLESPKFSAIRAARTK